MRRGLGESAEGFGAKGVGFRCKGVRGLRTVHYRWCSPFSEGANELTGQLRRADRSGAEELTGKLFKADGSARRELTGRHLRT